MADKVSQDSLSVTDEFVVVSPSEGPSEMANSGGAGSVRSEEGLKIAGNGNMEELQHHLEEVLDEQTGSDRGDTSTEATSSTESFVSSSKTDTSEGEAGHQPLSPSRLQMKTLEQKVLNSHVHLDSPQDDGPSPPPNVTSDPWEPRSHEERSSDPEVGSLTINPLEKTCTLFSGIVYLGSATVNAPKSELEVARNMTILREQESQTAIKIVLSVPRTSEGSVRLLERDGRSEISHFRITKILFCCRGLESGAESDCFAFTCSHGSKDSQLFQCHVFRCENPEAKVLSCFKQAFFRVPRSPQSVESSMHVRPVAREKILNLTVPVFVDIREDDGRGSFSPIPRDNRCFKMRQGARKEIIVTVQPTNSKSLNIERCFGVLICPGRNVPDRDLHLLDVVRQEHSQEGKQFTVTSLWDPNLDDLTILNTESPPGLVDKSMFMTIAVDLVMTGIQEQVRFVLETRVIIVSPNEKFWMYNKKAVQEFFYILLEEEESSVENEFSYKVLSLESQTQRERLQTRSGMRPSVRTPDSLSSYQEEEESDDEPLQSGSGNVDKDCAEDILITWGNILSKWRTDFTTRPKQLKPLVREGIPEALRGEVWQLLSGVHMSEHLFERYRVLITKDSPMEEMITRDISRTFTAHEKFQTEDEGGQEAMLKISKAYSIYDPDVAYCQGMSFLTAVLWLHMPEEQAFAILVKIMYDYQLRDLFLDNFKDLHVKFYQLDRLIEDLLPDLFSHFDHIGIEVHMFASQWFLTLFTHKFPLTTVFHIIDVFLSEGMGVLFNVSIALLKASKKELLGQDFEGILKYFRVTLPKRYRTEEAALELIQLAMSTKINSKKLKRYEKDFYAIKEMEEREDPMSRMERENKSLVKSNMRLEQENDELAHELITYKLAMEKQLDNERDRVLDFDKEVKSLKLQLMEFKEENNHLESETCKVKEMYREVTEKAEADLQKYKRNETIISEYKQICSQQSERLEKLQQERRDDLLHLKSKLQPCTKCANYISEDGKLVESIRDVVAGGEVQENDQLKKAQTTIKDLEMELAATKLELVESQCKSQDLEHRINNCDPSRNRTDSWMMKKISSFTAAKKE
ncbi:rab GTPase-activating protein 1-like isoform X2 [Apostichopus japonicus]|uniref:rab GTPase-activating protein 1-like isoform X2 n=1 Tax=Stichopus japonicus TaxID=307972 RepID=UPI003AB149E6